MTKVTSEKKISPSVCLPSAQTGISSQAASIISDKVTDAHLIPNLSCIHCDSATCITNRSSPQWKHSLILMVCYMISLSELERKNSIIINHKKVPKIKIVFNKNFEKKLFRKKKAIEILNLW